MWVLLIVTLVSEGVYVEGYGEYKTFDECIYAIHDAEITVNEINEGMLCLHVGELHNDSN